MKEMILRCPLSLRDVSLLMQNMAPVSLQLGDGFHLKAQSAEDSDANIDNYLVG